jgi:hypothetical protein
MHFPGDSLARKKRIAHFAHRLRLVGNMGRAAPAEKIRFPCEGSFRKVHTHVRAETASSRPTSRINLVARGAAVLSAMGLALPQEALL